MQEEAAPEGAHLGALLGALVLLVVAAGCALVEFQLALGYKYAQVQTQSFIHQSHDRRRPGRTLFGPF